MEQTKSNPMKRLLSFAGQCRGKMIAAVVLAVISVIGEMIPYFAIAKITVDLLENHYTMRGILVSVLVALLGYTVKVIGNALSTSLSHQAAYSIIQNIRTSLTNKLFKVPLGYVLEKPSGEIKTIMVDTTEKLEPPLAHLIPEMTSNLLIPIGVLAYLFYVDFRMALISLITIPIAFIFYIPLMKKYGYYYQKNVEAGNHMNAQVVEYVKGIEAIKAFNQSATSYEKYSDAVKNSCDAITTFFVKTLFEYTAVMTIMPSTLLFVLPAGLYFYMKGTLSIASFVTCLILGFGLVGPLIKAMQYTDNIASMGTIINEVCQILDAKEMERPKTYIPLSNYKIKFEEVTFGYNVTEILHGVSFETIPKGMTAIVGPSGSGKSTVAKLMASFWEASGGKIRIGNKDIKELSLDQISEIISYVAQENFLFNLSVKENIRMGKKDATDEEVIAAAKKASCHEFIMALEKGYDTLAGEAGSHFSGGERQRIAIARAILKNSPIIILDEATAYTDPENEAIIQESISKLVKGKTLIVIAHRLSTICLADNIVVMNKGKVVAQGKQEALLASCPLYKDMWEAHIDAKDTDALKGGRHYA